MVHRIWEPYPHIQKNLNRVKEIMISEMTVIHPDVKAKILDYINAPGKYVRAGLCLLFSADSEGNIPEGKLYLAAYIELLHLATLLHDDVIDEANSRRGIMVINKSHSNRIAIYAGDYLLVYANRLAVKGAELLEVTQKDVQITNRNLLERILAGELSQLMNQFRSDMTMKDYLKQIKGKTAFLFAMACQIGDWRPNMSRKRSHIAFQLGQHIGMAFQISDDLIDYQISQDDSGKPRMQDIQNGIYTAPYLFAQNLSKDFQNHLKTLNLRELGEDDLVRLYDLMNKAGAFEKTEELVDAFLKKAFASLDKMAITEADTIKQFLAQLMDRQF